MKNNAFSYKGPLLLFTSIIFCAAVISAFKPAKPVAGISGASILTADLAPALLVKMLTTDTASVPLAIRDIDIDIKVTGNIAVTTMTLNFYNDVTRNLEGEFVFPLSQGQSIHYFAMGVGDSMRTGEVVEKGQGRQVFEAVVRTKIDPGLLEWTQGNNFRARVFPIPAKGYKKFVIGFQQELTAGDNSFLYSLPLAFRNKVSHFSIKAEVNGSQQSPVPAADNAYLLDFKNDKDKWLTAVEYKNIIPNKAVAFEVPATDNLPAIYTAKVPGTADSYYFYALVNTHKVNIEKQLPNNIGILWDVSGSASKRNRDKELKIIENYLDRAGNAQVKVIVFSVAVHAVKDFNIQNGNSVALRDYLQSFEPDGGTQLGCLHLVDYNCDEFLLFSDGVQTFGSDSIQFSKSPVDCISTGSSADFSALQFISRCTGGKFINGEVADPATVTSSLAQSDFSYLSAQALSGQLTSVYPSLPIACGTYQGIAGIMTGKTGQLQLNFGTGSATPVSLNLNITTQHNADAELLGRLWAQKKIAELDLQYDKNKNEITALGKQYSIITRNTSLIVLDRLMDYIRYQIVPPDSDMKKQYYTFLRNEDKDDKANSDVRNRTHLTQVENDFNDIVNWWNKEFKPGKSDIKNKTEENGSSYEWNTTDSSVASTEGTARPTIRFVEMSVRHSGEGNGATQGQYAISNTQTSGSVAAYAYTISVTNEDEVRNTSPVGPNLSFKKDAEEKAAESFASGNPPAKGSIKLTGWDPDEPYLNELKKTKETDLYKKYLLLRKQYQTSPSFFLDVADYFTKMNQRSDAIRIVSNLAEFKTEDQELLRILAHHLQQWNEMTPAISTYENVLKLRPDEPQSYRDLGLAYAQNKEYQKAEDILSKVVNRAWDGRFPTIEAFTTCEINHMLSQCPVKINTDSLDKRLIKNMPVDVRVVIDWDADNCDIDLWVTDPRGEKCYYGNRLTQAGARISSDFTGGYGPEDFNLKKALPGVYKVQVNYFGSHKQTLAGPVTVHAQMYTNYGRPNEVKKETTVRLISDKEVIDIGEFEFVR